MEFLKLSKLTDEEKQQLWNDAVQGEWWISQDGESYYADSDSGIGYDHEHYVRQQIMSNHGLYLDETDDELRREILYTVMGSNWQNRINDQPVLPGMEFTEEEQANDTPEQQMMRVANPYERQHMEELFQSAKRIQEDNATEQDYILWGLSPEETEIMIGKGDFRQYAMKNWGWKRVINRDIETWNLTRKDLDAIATGLYDASDVNDNTQFNIEVASSRKSYWNVPYWVIGDGNPAKLQPYRTGEHGQVLSRVIKTLERTGQYRKVDRLLISHTV